MKDNFSSVGPFVFGVSDSPDDVFVAGKQSLLQLGRVGRVPSLDNAFDGHSVNVRLDPSTLVENVLGK